MESLVFSSPSSNPPPDIRWTHDVFLCFRGEDTRKNFADHLFTALHQEGILTYLDHETLPLGDSISPSLYRAIEESRIYVIVFSKNYADSSWSLKLSKVPDEMVRSLMLSRSLKMSEVPEDL
ncbi:nucleotide-binding site protein [Artemisia annua]|uniref:Nucleotide-binding site protein n=1 Tax=Artemisia annua TaxID=35608 RepID=A0A2U1M7A1_ARTAN|nr:nucleotide-binding site protein [Artemisia annua]